MKKARKKRPKHMKKSRKKTKNEHLVGPGNVHNVFQALPQKTPKAQKTQKKRKENVNDRKSSKNWFQTCRNRKKT